MRCPHCNGRVSDESICPYCKNDLEEWRKANVEITRPTRLKAV